jgi:exodeoxyribonuclease V alpha subunit
LQPDEGRGVAPLVLRDDQLYLQRFDMLETLLARSVRARVQGARTSLSAEDQNRLSVLFPDAQHGGDAGQRDAASMALSAPLAVITGGPGTGKTTTVLRMLVALLARAPHDQLPEILLLAPTGKAASQLTESIVQGLERLPHGVLDDVRRTAIPVRAQTIHRALGVHPDRPHRPRHHAGNQLAADIVVVDETSMVDLPLMARLFDAVRSDARLVLLGDSDQLASVDAGAVLRDLVEAPALSTSCAMLTHSRRFSDDSALGALVIALRGDSWSAVQHALQSSDASVQQLPMPNFETVPYEVLRAVREHTQRLRATATPEAALEELGRFRLLTALRRSPIGATAINDFFVRELGGALAAGAPVLIVENAPDDGLANGDLGVVWQPESGERVALFAGADGPRAIPLRRLPAREPAFAMTVHKAQGSEFDEVMVLLPAPPSPILTRELLYTAVSRARRRVTVVGPAAAVAEAHATRVRRATGLRQRLSRPAE